jgi:hypothetical protein
MARLITIVKDFTDQPGARYPWEGPNSGVDFRHKLLENAYLEALKDGDELTINFDGAQGYASSFLEESFGGLARLYDQRDVASRLKFVCTEEPSIIEECETFVREARLTENEKKRHAKAARARIIPTGVSPTTR